VKSGYSVLLLGYMPVSIAGGVRKAVGGYLRYMQFRDQESEPDAEGGLDAYVRYIAHRDRTSPNGRIFGADGALTSADRHRLVDYVARSTKGLTPKWVKGRDGKLEDRQRAVYQFVISPEDWRGLDLRLLARTTMKQLEADAGVKRLGPWFAAEHRNTSHHHVQIVLAARSEVAPGTFSTLIINRARLQRMKEAIWTEIARQRGLERQTVVEQHLTERRPVERRAPSVPAHPLRWRRVPHLERSVGGARKGSFRFGRIARTHGRPLNEAMLRIRGVALRYRFRIDRELEAEQLRGEREGWER
jgi:hypothetical protein